MALKIELEDIIKKKSQDFTSTDNEQLKLNCKQSIKINIKQEKINKLKNISTQLKIKHQKEKEEVDALEQYDRC